MPRLLHIMDYKPRGMRTMDHFILALAEGLAARGWEVRFAFGAEPPEEYRTALFGAGAQYVVIPFPFTRNASRDLTRKLKGFKPDVTQTSFLSAFCRPLLRLKLTGWTKKLVVIDHSSGQTPIRKGAMRALARLRGWMVGRIVDAIVPVSKAIAERDVERVFLPARKVRVVYNGIVPENFPNPPRPVREMIRVVYAGQLLPQKGVITLLRALVKLRRQGIHNCEVLIAGTGPQERELVAYCRDAGLRDVSFLGYIDSIPELFGTAEIVVVPSIWFEAFGLVVIEAMACGAVCLVSDAGALPEVVGEAGRVFASDDENDLADKLIELIGDSALRRRLSEAGRKRVEVEFALKNTVAAQIMICETVHRGSCVTGHSSGS